MNSRINILVNAAPMVKVRTGISRYLRSLYLEMERLYGNILQIGYFDGIRVSSTMPRGPASMSRWAGGVDLFWRLPSFPALFVRLAAHFLSEVIFRKYADKYDLYHEAGFFPFVGPSRLKTVFTVHDLSLIRFPEYHPRERVLYSRLFFRRRCKSVNRFLAVSEFTSKEMRSLLKIDAKRITVTREAHDPNIFYPRSPRQIRVFLRRYNLPERYFLFVGSGDPRKKLNVAAEALSNVGLKMPLVAVGWSGWFNDRLWKNVIPLGYVNDDELAQAYSGALALIFPSTYEGFGLPVLEAMACGCPAVTTRESSLPEVAGDAALYLKQPACSADLGRLLKEIAANTSLRDEIALKAKRRAKQFSWEQTALTTFQVFRQLLDE